MCQSQIILFKNDETRRAVEAITAATPSYNFHERERIISINAKPVSHPYFTKYRLLQKLCLAILRYQKLKYGSDSKQIYGILFDGAWLWEEYLATILIRCGFKHPRNKESAGAICVWNGNPRYPDFYKGTWQKTFEYGTAIPSNNYILDAKYKRLSDASIDRDDVNQMVTYMHILPANRAGLIYPCSENNNQKTYTVYGIGGQLEKIGFKISLQAKDYKDFCKQMETSEKELLKALNI